MSRENPTNAIEALAGRSYNLRGKTVRNSNMVLFALAKCGYGIESLSSDARFVEAIPLVAYAMLNPVREVAEMIASGANVMAVALEFCEDFSPEEMGEVGAIFQDCLLRFRNSMARTSESGSAGNVKAAAAIS
jgi:hypothetical protein